MRRAGEVIAEQEIVVVATNRDGRPVRLPEGMAAALARYLAG
jgi:acyl-CoA thioesterase FadM